MSDPISQEVWAEHEAWLKARNGSGSEDADSRRGYAAFVLGGSLTAVEALAKGVPVPREQLNAELLERLGEPLEGEPLTLSDELALRVVLAPPAGSDEAAPLRLAVWTGRELSELPDRGDTDMLVGPLIGRGARTIIVGDTGHGKSTLANQFGSAALTGVECLGYQGAGAGPVVIVDLEQGLRSLKRAAHEAGFDKRDDVFYVLAPDGLALDSNDTDRGELERVIAAHRPAVLILDPYYKAHRGDANEERAVVDLMRYLDGLRAQYGFALILPAHPRKDPTSSGARKLTLHDVAGSGAIVRGAEVVIGLERLSHGYARLRILKDRDGDLSVGDVWPLIFTRGEGFKLDPKEDKTAEQLETHIAADRSGEWRTVKEWAAELGIREGRARKLLERLAESQAVESRIGPPGRSPRAHCYRTAPEGWEKSGAVTPTLLDAETAPDPAPFRGPENGEQSSGTAPEAGAVTEGEGE
jgi:KaiC/GvpD/RAD55 family RecA-like ATPase